MLAIDVWEYPNPLSPIGRRKHKVLIDKPTTCAAALRTCGVAVGGNVLMVNGASATPDTVLRGGEIVSAHRDAQIDPASIAFFLINLGVSGTVAVALASFTVSAIYAIGANLLVNALFAPDTPDNGKLSIDDVPNAYSVSSANNQVRSYQPLPLLMGNVRFSPDVDARPWTQFVKDPQNIRQQTVVETVNRIMHAAYYQCDDWGCPGWVDTGQDAFRPYPNNPPNYGYLTPWENWGSNIFRTANYGYVSQSSTDWRELFYNSTTGLYGKSSSGPWTSFGEAVHSYTFTRNVTGQFPETTQELTQVFNFGLGDLSITDVRFGQTKITQFAGVTHGHATFAQDSTFFGFAHPNSPYGSATDWKLNVIAVEGGELRQNANVSDSGWIKRDFYGTDCQYIQVDISGRLYYSGNNGPENASCSFEIAYRAPGGAWIQVHAFTLTNGDAFPVRETFGWSVPLGSSYEVRTRKTTVDSTDARLTQDFEMFQVKFFRPEPVEAANPFTKHPAQNRYAIAVRAGGQINGTVDNMNAYCSSKCWVWAGGAGTTPTTPVGGTNWSWRNTENPAWWFLYYAMGGFRLSAPDPGSPFNGRGWCVGPEKADGPRMFGAGLRQERIDLEALAAWAAFCNSYNLRFNAVLRDQGNVAEILSKIARIGRASPTWQSGKLGVVWEDPASVPVARFGMPSIKRDTMSITYLGYNAPDEIVAAFTNPNDDWKEDEVRKVVPGVVLPNSEVRVTLWGCKYKEQAQREVNLIAARQFYQRRRVTFETAQEGLPIMRGDVILLAHDMTNWAYSSRLTEQTTGSTLVLTREIDPLPGALLDVAIVAPDGTTSFATANMPTQPTNTVSLNTGGVPLVNFAAFPDAIPEDWVAYLSTTDTADVGKRMRVTAVEPGDGYGIKITCTDERLEMWAYENSNSNPTDLGDSEERLIAIVQDLSATRDPCTNDVLVRWETINCRGAIVTINGSSVNVWGTELRITAPQQGSTYSIAAQPLLQLAAVRSVGDSGVFTV